MAGTPPRKRNGDERRRELCDAAMEVLAEQGSRGLTHAQVDSRAGVPDGTTSYYYRTRAALLRGVGKRVEEIDSANLRSVIDAPPDANSPFARLAELTMMQAAGSGLVLNRARHELLLAAVRDPDIAETTQAFVGRINAMTHEAIAHLQPATDDPELLAEQTTAVMTFIGGVFFRLAVGDRAIRDAGQLARLLQAIARAVSQEAQRA